ncbi:MAG: hypothetical protein AAFO99_14970 [Bacteroidota bacterium]
MKAKRVFVMASLLFTLGLISSCEGNDGLETESLYDNIEAIDKEDVEDPGTRGEN